MDKAGTDRNGARSSQSRSPGSTSSRREPLTGLTAAEVLAARASHGENRLPSQDGASAWTILLGQFKSPLIYIILAAAGISLALGELGDFAIIIVVVAVDVLLGFVQEYQAQRTYVALKGLLKPTTTVIRDGQRQEVEVWELVPGDLVVLTTGDKTPADGDVIEATRLAVDEAILTGESEPVTKSAGTDRPPDGAAASAGEATEAADQEARRWRVFMGSTVITGRGVMRVTAIGLRTELGQIAASLAAREEESTPLQVRLRDFSSVLTWVVVAATVVILVIGLLLGREFLDMLRTSIILAVAAVPEGLIIAVTVILVLGMRKILRRRGLVRRLLAVETLGSVTTICTDKTGTVTEGRMRVNRADLADEQQALQTMVLCNNLEGPVDVALWEYAERHLPGSPQDLFDGSERLAEELFTSETKYMIAAVTSNRLAGERWYFLKGAPEIVLGMCTVNAEEGKRLLAEADQWARDGLRLLGLACRVGGVLEDGTGYTWVGLVGMEDPVRAEVQEAVRVAHQAGIRVVMITGDYPVTAESIAATIGIPVSSPILEGRDIATMSADQLRQAVRDTTVFARIRPQDKLRIIRALAANGEVTAMIGDGVNDAPALRHANIGVVVGTASDVARETADLILLDNNFRTVVAAVEEGRVIFDNIRKVVAYVLSDSYSEVLTVFIAMMLGWPAPLLVAQILWINLICDGPQDIVLGFEPKEPGIMDRRPRSPKEPIVDRFGATLIAAVSIATALFALVLFGYYHLVLDRPEEGRSIVFVSFATSSVLYVLAYRSLRVPLFRMNPITANRPLMLAVAGGLLAAVLPFLIPALGDLLGVVPLSLLEWAVVAGFGIALLGVVELAKSIADRVSEPA